jgi:predicted ATP-grasp superfamily ATP-dependent carboligase
MQVLVFEWLTGGGRWVESVEPRSDDPLQQQGLQMLEAIVGDFISGGVSVVVPLDTRLTASFKDFNQMGAAGENLLDCSVIKSADQLRNWLGSTATQVDYVLMIAPETEGCLLKSLAWIGDACSKLISPGVEIVELCSYKQATFDHLQAAGFSSFPPGAILANPLQEYPKQSTSSAQAWVLKPNDGAGSEHVQLIEDLAALGPKDRLRFAGYRIEEFIPGTPVSVSVICHGEQFQFLEPTQQLFAHQPFGEYVGARLPIDPRISERAKRLAERVMRAMPTTQGYLGLDLIISDESEVHDCLIEINPRLTMSYLKLREIYSENIALQMLPESRSSDCHFPLREIKNQTVLALQRNSGRAPG